MCQEWMLRDWLKLQEIIYLPEEHCLHVQKLGVISSSIERDEIASKR